MTKVDRPHYWLVCTSPANFEVSRGISFRVNGFRERNRKTVEKIHPGDRIVFYINDIRKFGATATATSGFYIEKKERIWIERDELWPCRFKQEPDIVLDQDESLDARKLVQSLSFITEKQKQTNWGLAFHQSLRNIPKDDFELV